MKLITVSTRVLVLSVCISGFLFAKDPVTAVGHDTKKATVETGKAVGRGARDTGKGVTKGSEEAARGVAKTGEETAHLTKGAAKETGKGVKRVF